MSETVFSLDQLARRLRIRPTTIEYWIRMFSDLVAIPVDEHGAYQFGPQHVALFTRIRESALDRDLPLKAIRKQLASPSGDIVNSSDEIRQLLNEVKALREEIAFLSEESKELHRMLALVARHVLPGRTEHQGLRIQKSGRFCVSDVANDVPGTYETVPQEIADAEQTVNQVAAATWSPPKLGAT